MEAGKFFFVCVSDRMQFRSEACFAFELQQSHSWTYLVSLSGEEKAKTSLSKCYHFLNFVCRNGADISIHFFNLRINFIFSMIYVSTHLYTPNQSCSFFLFLFQSVSDKEMKEVLQNYNDYYPIKRIYDVWINFPSRQLDLEDHLMRWPHKSILPGAQICTCGCWTEVVQTNQHHMRN